MSMFRLNSLFNVRPVSTSTRYSSQSDDESYSQTSESDDSQKMIKKWKVTPVSNVKPEASSSNNNVKVTSYQQQRPTTVIRPVTNRQRSFENSNYSINSSASIRSYKSNYSKDDSTPPKVISRESIEIRPKKPRRHTTEGGKQTLDDIRLAKEINEATMNGGCVTNELGQEVDPNSTLGRKQLISMLKQRYGSEMENYRNVDKIEKDQTRRDRHREREMRHEQKVHRDNRELIQNGGAHHSPSMNGTIQPQRNGVRHSSGESSEWSEDSASSPKVHRVKVTATYQNARKTTVSDDDSERSSRNIAKKQQTDGDERVKLTKAVVFLQFLDEVKRVNLPANLSSTDALKVLFVNAFPGKIAMPHFENGSKMIYIKDMESGVYYDLEDASEVVNRSFLKIHENEADLSVINYKQVPDHREYASSLHNFNTNPPRLQRYDSGNSLRSDNVLTRPTYVEKVHAQPLFVQAEPRVISEPQIHAQPEFQVNAQPQLHEESQINTPHNYQTKSEEIINTKKVETITNKSHSSSFSEQVKKPQSHGTNYSSNSAGVRVTTSNGGRVTSSNAGAAKTPSAGRVTSDVEEQLADLSDLLQDVMENNTEDESHQDFEYNIDLKNPGKLDRSLIDNLQNQSERSRKKSLPKHFQATVLVKAQQEEHQRQHTPDNEAHREKSSSFVTTSHKGNFYNAVASEDVKKAEQNKKYTEQKQKTAIQASYISTPNKYIARKFDTGEESSEDIATDLLDQLIDLEEEVKKSGSGHTSSSHTSRRSSVSSTTSRSNTQVDTKRTEANDRINSHEVTRLQSKGSTNDIYTANENMNKSGSFDRVDYSREARSFSKSSRSSESSNSESTGQYSKINKNMTKSFSTNSKKTTTFGAESDVVESNEDVFDGSHNSSLNEGRTASFTNREYNTRICQPPSVTTPDFIELEDSARSVNVNISRLREDLQKMREYHIENTRMFKADLQKKLLLFRKKSARVEEVIQQKLETNTNNVFANEHPVRERRHRLTTDQTEYHNKMSDTTNKLRTLEKEMESTRLEVVGKKRVDDPQKLDELHSNLTNLTRGLADIKNKFHGLHDMLKVVAKSELEVIKMEDIFVKEEPDNLEQLIQRCKTLSTTLFTLEKLAAVQNDHSNNNVTSQNNNTTLPKPSSYRAEPSFKSTSRSKSMSTSNRYYQPPEYQEIDTSVPVNKVSSSMPVSKDYWNKPRR